MREMTNLVLEALDAGPPTHNERIVGGQDRDHVDALCFELVILGEVRREMLGMASGLGLSG